MSEHERRNALLFVAYVGVLLLGCSSSWKTQPAQPPAPVEQKTTTESLRQKAVAARGSAPEALTYADAVVEHLRSGAAPNAEADPGQALELLDAARDANPLQAAELTHGRGRVEFALQDYEVAIATFTDNATNRGFARSATEVVRYHAATGDRAALESFCNSSFAGLRGGDAKHEFIEECVAGMGYSSPAEWSLMSAPAVEEYERWRAGRAQTARDERAAQAARAQAAREDEVRREQAAREAQADEEASRNCRLRCAEKEATCKSSCYGDESCRRDCSDAEWACRRQC